MSDIIVYDGQDNGAEFKGVSEVRFDAVGGGFVRFFDTKDATAGSDDILDGMTAYADGQKIEGTFRRNSNAVYVGSTPEKLYINGALFGILYGMMNDYGFDSQPFSLLEMEQDGNSDSLVISARYSIDELLVTATITSGGKTQTVNLYGLLGLMVPMLDLSGLSLPPVSFVSPLVPYNDTAGSEFFSSQPVVFGLPRPQYLLSQGDVLTELHFNTAIASDTMNELFQILSYDQTDQATGLKYDFLGLDYLCVADLSSVGLGSGYLMYWGDGLTPIYSTTTFDASAFMPGFRVDKVGWQTGSIQMPTSVTVNFGDFHLLLSFVLDQFLSKEKITFGGDTEPDPFIVPKQTISFAFADTYGAYGGFAKGPYQLLTEGKTYMVAWDGEEYQCTAFTAMGAGVVGNAGFLGGANTGEPFLMGIQNQTGYADGTGAFMCLTPDTSATHAISIKEE